METGIKLKAFNPEVFLAYDIRGLYPEKLDHNTIELVARGFAEYLGRRASSRLLLVGRDIRESSLEISEIVAGALLKSGFDVWDLGEITTPLMSFALSRSRAAGGVMVTASHNSIRQNGLKLYEETRSLSETKGLGEIKKFILKGDFSQVSRRGRFLKKNFKKEYAEFLAQNVSLERKVKALFDPGGGTVGLFLPQVIEKILVEPIYLNLEPDPTLSRREPNPLLPQAQRFGREFILRDGAEMGFLFDPDGDRLVVLDERGKARRGDEILWLLAKNLGGRGESVVYDLRSSQALREDLEEWGMRPALSRVGRSFINEAMRDEDAILGGELSGHFFFRDFFFAESALLAMLKILEIVSRSKDSLSRILRPYNRYFHSGELNFEVYERQRFLKIVEETFKGGERNYLDGLTVKYPSWWFNLRPSNTEEMVRLVFEARNSLIFEEKKKEFLSLFQALGAREI